MSGIDWLNQKEMIWWKIIENLLVQSEKNMKWKKKKWMKNLGKKPDERLILIIICDHKKKQTKWG